MTVSFCADEHVPRVFVTTLRSNGYEVVRASDVCGDGTEDRHLLEYCGGAEHVLVTNDKKDFGGTVGDAIDHAGIIIYTDSTGVRTDPDGAVRALERVLDAFTPDELAGERIWLDQWRASG